AWIAVRISPDAKAVSRGSAVVAEYTLMNLSPFEFRFVWAQHALMSLASPVEFDSHAGQAFRLSHDAEGHVIDNDFAWPKTPGGEDLSRPINLPGRKGWKSFSVEPIQDPWEIRYPNRKRSVRVAYSSADGL